MQTSETVSKRQLHKEEDFHGWLTQQAALLRAGLSGIDAGGIAQELEAMAASEKRELKSRFIVLLVHLLKWRWCGGAKSPHGRGWRLTIREQRRSIAALLEDSPSLRGLPSVLLADLYEQAREDAVIETGLEEFLAKCPWQVEEILEIDFYPNQE